MTDLNPTIVDPGGSFVMPTEAQTLKDIADKHPCIPASLIMDVYLILRNQGKLSFMPEEDLLDDLDRSAPGYWDLRSNVAAKKVYLERLSKSVYLQELVKLNDAFKALNVFVAHMVQNIAARSKRAKEAYVDGKGNDADYDEKAYASDGDLAEQLPEYEEGTSFDQFMGETPGGGQQVSPDPSEAVEDPLMASFMSASEGCGRSGMNTHTKDPSRALSQALISQAASLPTLYPLLFQCYQDILEDLAVGKAITVDTDNEANRKKVDDLDDIGKLSSADPASVASETFEKQVLDRSLQVHHNQADDKQHLSHVFIILDVSGSMGTADLGGRIARAFAANVIALALLNFASTKNHKVWLLPFESFPGDVVTASNRQEAIKAAHWLGSLNYDGGGTDIGRAVLKAYDLTTADPCYEKADLVLITDGACSIPEEVTTKKPERTKLRTLILSEEISKKDKSLAPLIKASDAWYRVGWDRKNNTLTVGKSLSGISAPHSHIDPDDNQT